jgi:transcriptional regulator with XRE-family HTH domain
MQDSAQDPVQAEVARILHVLRSVVTESGLSVRALERKAGVGYTTFQKVLLGKVTPQLDHILRIARAAGISWPELFSRCYGDAPIAKASEARGNILDELVRDAMVRALRDEDVRDALGLPRVLKA